VTPRRRAWAWSCGTFRQKDETNTVVNAANWSAPKAGRILDATRELLLRRGSHGVTISEVARLAHVGKGTVYLYWDTKEALLVELFARDFLAALDHVTATVTAEPHMIVPHRLFPLMQRTIREHPFIVAIQTKDVELLGLLDGHPDLRKLRGFVGPPAILAQILPALREHGVVRTDLSVEAQAYAMTALLHGLLDLDNTEPTAELLQRDIGDPDEVLADVCRVMLEPAEPADAAAVATAAATILDKIKQAREAALAALEQLSTPQNTRAT
jgi:AcrR family transcriptional regulator